MQGSPLEQFAIYKLSFLGYVLGPFFTNFLFFALVALAVAGILFGYGSLNYKIVPDRWSGFIENYYLYVYNLIKENAGSRAQIFLPFLSTVFFFILISNLLGMFPFGYAITSQILITFLFSCSIFLGTIFLGLRRHGINFFSLFFPSGSPAYMAFLLVPIELLSFIARPFSLGIRLFANMLAGHVLLKILSTFILIGVFWVQALDVSAISLAFKQSWIAEKIAPGQLTNPSHTYIGVDQPGLVELTRVYYEPRVFDFSGMIEASSEVNKRTWVSFDLSDPSERLKRPTPLDEFVRIGKDMLQRTRKPSIIDPNYFYSFSKNGPKETSCVFSDMNSPEFQKRLRELWESPPTFWDIPCVPDGPSASFWRWFLYGGFETKKPLEFSSIDDPGLWRYVQMMFKCPSSRGISPFAPFMEAYKETQLNQVEVSSPKHFPFIYGLPHSNKTFLFSFGTSFLSFFNFFSSPALLALKGLLIVLQLGLLLAFVILELGIAFLQAYVFMILTTIYINDSLQLH